MRVLITGGLGYLGGRLAKYLLERGCGVVLGTRQSARPINWLSGAELVQIRWNSSEYLERICAGVDMVVHTAGMNAEECRADPVAALDFNGVATARLLQAMIRQGGRRFIHFSTAHVYGSPLAGLITEETCLLNLHPYATSHRAGEDIVRAAHQSGKVEGIVVRLSNAFGAPVHKEANCWKLLFNDLCLQAVSTQKISLRSSGLQQRDFVPITDVCRAVEHLLHLPSDDLGAGLFNVGGGWVPTVFDVACLICDRCEMVLGFRPELSRIPLKKEESVIDLDYRTDALCQTGFELGADRILEVDFLLGFCRATFA